MEIFRAKPTYLNQHNELPNFSGTSQEIAQNSLQHHLKPFFFAKKTFHFSATNWLSFQMRLLIVDHSVNNKKF